MRLKPRTAPTPDKVRYDVLISQLIGKPTNGSLVRSTPTGGSEFQVVVLAEALAERGYRVGVLTPDGAHCHANGVDYVPATSVIGAYVDPHTGEQRITTEIETDVLVSERFGPLPNGVSFIRLVFDLHDLPDARLGPVMQAMSDIKDSKVVVHSGFMHRLLPGWPRLSVIPCMLPDSFYGRERPPSQRKAKDPARHYVYGSAAMKGLEATMALWRKVKHRKEFKHATLTITSPGYDQINPEWIKGAKDVVVMTGLSPAGMQVLLAQSDGLFMVSTFPETFGIVFHQCELAGKPARVLRAHGNVDALDETVEGLTVFDSEADFVASFSEDVAVESYNFSVSRHIDKWIDELGLKQQSEAA